ncbi:MAG: hypothetical protein HOQ00_09455, partial [Agromyces sp.]|nr:hypothetical protein [Agromyces sp.]
MTNDTDATVGGRVAPGEAGRVSRPSDASAETGLDTAASLPTRPAEQEGPELSIVTPLDVPGQPRLDLDRALEAILCIADEPLSVVTLAAAVARPVAEIRAAIAR